MRRDRRPAELAEERRQQRERMSAALGKAIRETAYALGRGDGRVSLDGGRHWHPKRDLVCSGDCLSLRLELPNGEWTWSDYDMLLKHMACSEADSRQIRETARTVDAIARAVAGEGMPDAAILGKDRLWCIVVLLEGDVAFGCR